MHVKSSILDSKGETKTHEILKRFQDRYAIHVGVRFFKVLEYQMPGISDGERKYLNTTEFDFLICERETLRPLFGIDYDGIGKDAAKFDEHRLIKRQAKEKACDIAKFPFVWLEPMTDIEGTTILDAMIESYEGGVAIAKMVAAGDLAYDETFCYDFPPLAKMRERLSLFFAGNNVEWDPKEPNVSWQEYRFQTDQGQITIRKKGVIRAVCFPYFHAMEVASDIAAYRCLKEFEYRLNKGEFTVDGIITRFKTAVKQMKETRADAANIDIEKIDPFAG